MTKFDETQRLSKMSVFDNAAQELRDVCNELTRQVLHKYYGKSRTCGLNEEEFVIKHVRRTSEDRNIGTLERLQRNGI